MVDTSFFPAGSAMRIGEIASLVGARVLGDGSQDVHIRGIAPLHSATQQDVSFLNSAKYRPDYDNSDFGACLITASLAESLPVRATVLIVDDIPAALATLAGIFYAVPPLLPAAGIHPTASVDDTAHIGENVAIGAGSIIGPHVQVGDNCQIGHYVVIGAHVVLGEDCVIEHHCTIHYCRAGARVRLFSGARVGQDGFGYTHETPPYKPIPQLGRVIIGDDVDIGANTCIDRGSFDDTVIGRGTKIDNLVQIAHNVHFGEDCFIAAQVGIAGSTHVGHRVLMGGQVGVAGHIKVGDDTVIMAKSGIVRSIADGPKNIAGIPAQPHREWLLRQKIMKRLMIRHEQEAQADAIERKKRHE